jgi:hypothetical protein
MNLGSRERGFIVGVTTKLRKHFCDIEIKPLKQRMSLLQSIAHVSCFEL